MDQKNSKIAIYPGTFDPLTNGHVSLIRRGCEIFDRLIVAVAKDTTKTTLFSLDERKDLIRLVFAGHPQIQVEPFSGLLVEYAENMGAKVILRGLRAVSDFDYEFQMTLMNRKLTRNVQTVFLTTDYQWLFTSSTLVKHTASLGGDVRDLVPEEVFKALCGKYAAAS
ncbi:MAG: pantetheine-phosphate adenylyltransferase [Desulfovibrionaceae bacterium]|nr:pantetheine-phosphate adenylyltransferase [Desulfovibrionaceae bacterium]